MGLLSHLLFTRSVPPETKQASIHSESHRIALSLHLSTVAHSAIETVAGREFLLLARIIYSPVTWRTTNPTMDGENNVNRTPAFRRNCANTDLKSADSNASIDSVAHSASRWLARDESCHSQLSFGNHATRNTR